MAKVELIYLVIGFIVGSSVASMIIEYSYRKQLEQVNERFRMEMESMANDLPNITIREPDNSSQMVCECEECGDCFDNTPSFVRTAEEIAKHEYIPDAYDCTEFSNDLVYALRQDGWEAKQVIGYYYGNNGTSCDPELEKKYDCMHAWVVVEVPLEATGGWLIEPNIYDKYYSMKR